MSCHNVDNNHGIRIKNKHYVIHLNGSGGSIGNKLAERFEASVFIKCATLRHTVNVDLKNSKCTVKLERFRMCNSDLDLTHQLQCQSQLSHVFVWLRRGCTCSLCIVFSPSAAEPRCNKRCDAVT